MDTSEIEETPDPSTFPKRPLRVLSVFDGIDTGEYINNTWYCAEIDC